MGQCSSSLRQQERSANEGENQANELLENASANPSVNLLRRRRSTDGLLQRFKRPRPREEQDESRLGDNSRRSTESDENHNVPIEPPQPVPMNNPNDAEASEREASVHDSVSPGADLVLPASHSHPASTISPQSSISSRRASSISATRSLNAAEAAVSADVEEPSLFIPMHTRSSEDTQSDETEFVDALSVLPSLPDSPSSLLDHSDAHPPSPSSRPMPSPFAPMLPSPLTAPTRRPDDDEEQVIVLSRVLLAAATLTASHLVGEHISRGELYGSSDQISDMQQRAQTEITNRLNREREADVSDAEGERNSDNNYNDSQPPAYPATSNPPVEDASTSQLQSPQLQVQPPPVPLARPAYSSSASSSTSEDVDLQNDTYTSGNTVPQALQDDADSNSEGRSSASREQLSFPDFLEQLRTGRHSPELSQVMFDNERTTNFFRFFRFPEDRDGRIPILLMGIRSAEGARNGNDGEAASQSDADSPVQTRNDANQEVDGLSGAERSDGRRTFDNSSVDPRLNELSAEAARRHRILGMERMADSSPDSDAEDADSIYNASEEFEPHFGSVEPRYWEFDSDEDELSEAVGDYEFSDGNDPFLRNQNWRGSNHDNANDAHHSSAAVFPRTLADAHRALAREHRRHRLADHVHLGERNARVSGQPSSASFPADSGSAHAHHHTHSPPPSHDQRSTGTTNREQPASRDGRRSHHSWVIYVIGGAYPPTHPIFFAPSLATDNPTYEDMLIVEQLLGPVKPPVVSKDDLDSAGGFFIIKSDSPLLAERCPICLTDYACDDACRKLACDHVFHQECVDSWLTRSHNSCPMCRHEGVPSKASSNPDSNFRSRPDVATN